MVQADNRSLDNSNHSVAIAVWMTSRYSGASYCGVASADEATKEKPETGLFASKNFSASVALTTDYVFREKFNAPRIYSFREINQNLHNG
jgi:hypothetical protein